MESSKTSIILRKLFNKFVGQELTSKFRYFHGRKIWPNYSHPTDIVEFLLSERVSPSFDKYAKFADKVAVREYVKECGLEHILLNHYGVWEKPEDIEWDRLPNKFILKANNGCGNHVICKDKRKLDKQKAIETLNQSIYNGLHSDERHYRAIPPKVFAEELLDTGTDAWPTDYKIMCINGEPDHFFIACEREVSARYDTYDFSWNKLPYTKKEYLPHVVPEKPQHIEELIEYARILSHGIPVVRVDFYEFNGKIYFSELTFSPWGGFLYSYTDESIKLLGKKMGLK